MKTDALKLDIALKVDTLNKIKEGKDIAAKSIVCSDSKYYRGCYGLPDGYHATVDVQYLIP